MGFEGVEHRSGQPVVLVIGLLQGHYVGIGEPQKLGHPRQVVARGRLGLEHLVETQATPMRT